MMTVHNIAISGWYGADNAGDEAILEVFLTEVLRRRASHITVFGEDATRLQDRYHRLHVRGISHKRLIGPGSLRNWFQKSTWDQLRSALDSDVFVLGGGGLLRDDTSFGNVVRLLDEIWIAKARNHKVALYAVGVGPICTQWGKWIIPRTLALADLITVRDEGSRDALLRLGVRPESIILVADPALLLPPEPIPSPQLHFHVRNSLNRPQHFGIFLKNVPFLPQIAEAIDRLHESEGIRFVAVPLRCHNGCDDRFAAAEVQRRLKNPAALLLHQTPLSPSQVRWLAGQFPLNVSVRLHGAVFSYSAGVPVVALNYDTKVAYTMATFGVSNYVVNIDNSLVDTLIATVTHLYLNRTAAKQHILAQLPRLQDRARSFFSLLDAIESQ